MVTVYDVPAEPLILKVAEKLKENSKIVAPDWAEFVKTGTEAMELADQYAAERIIIDADALNIISENPALMTMVPRGSVMTPHLGELRHLGGDAGQLSRTSGCVVVQKGYGSRIFVPADGQGSMDTEQGGISVYMNTTGNPGMAKGGSGDVLTGLVGGLMARGYRADIAAMLGVWIHGYAGDVLSAECTQESYSSADLVGKLCCGFKVLYGE